MRHSQVQQIMQALIRSFEGRVVVIERSRKTYNRLGQQVMGWGVVYRGEALVVPATGDVATYGLGQVENKTPVLLVAGKRDIKQGDFLTVESRRYQVEFDPTWFESFMVLKLKQWEQ